MTDADYDVDLSIVLKWIVVIIAGGAIGLSTHIYLLKVISPIIAERMQGIVIKKPPYDMVITTIAYVTFVLPTIGTVLVYYFIQNFLPGKSRILKGILFGILILLVKGELFRQPIMNYMVGNPITITLIQQSQVCLSNLIMCVTVALLTPASRIESK